MPGHTGTLPSPSNVPDTLASMRFTTLGGRGAWPGPGQGCSGYLLQYHRTTLLIDPGYGTAGAVTDVVRVRDIDAVFVSHGHPDHCADLSALLRARVLADPDDRPPALPVFAPVGAVEAALALDEPETLDGSFERVEFAIGDSFGIGDFRASTVELPHFVPNAAARFDVQGRSLVYTGDGPGTAELVELARGSDVLVADATYVDEVPARHAGMLGTARSAGDVATDSQVARLLLTHLWPGTDPAASTQAARTAYDGVVDVASPGLVIEVPDP
jgi:ribonuclease BN (tRNA processing enzyme)